MIKGVLKLSNSILCNRDVLGRSFECEIDGIKASIHFPQFPIVDESKPQIGISNPLLAPEIGKQFSDHGDPLFWGIPVSYPAGNSSVNRLVISVECEETQNKDRAKVLYESYEQWVYSFIIYLMLETKQNLERNRNKDEFAFLQLVDDKYIPNMTPVNLCLNIPVNSSFASEVQIINAIHFANSGKELLFEYQMLLSAYCAIQENQNRRAIMDACVALEIFLVNQIKLTCQSKQTSSDTYNVDNLSLGERIKLIRLLDQRFPNKDYDNLIVKPRNDLMHGRCIYPEDEKTINLVLCVEEILNFYHKSYY